MVKDWVLRTAGSLKQHSHMSYISFLSFSKVLSLHFFILIVVIVILIFYLDFVFGQSVCLSLTLTFMMGSCHFIILPRTRPTGTRGRDTRSSRGSAASISSQPSS